MYVHGAAATWVAVRFQSQEEPCSTVVLLLAHIHVSEKSYIHQPGHTFTLYTCLRERQPEESQVSPQTLQACQKA